jgi:hypothetical protein
MIDVIFVHQMLRARIKKALMNAHATGVSLAMA